MASLQSRLDARDQARIQRYFTSHSLTYNPNSLEDRARLTDTVQRVVIIHGILTGILMFVGHYSHVYDLPTSNLLEIFGGDILAFRWLWGPIVKIKDVLFD